MCINYTLYLYPTGATLKEPNLQRNEKTTQILTEQAFCRKSSPQMDGMEMEAKNAAATLKSILC